MKNDFTRTSIPTRCRWTQTHIGRTGLLVILTACVAATIGILSFSYSGLCVSQGRFLSDQEYFDAAISGIIQRPSAQLRMSGTAGVTFRSVEVVRYESAATFRRDNPHCCEIVPHNVGDQGPYVSISERIFGKAAAIVSVSYALNYVDEGGDRKSVMNAERYAVTNCGRAWSARH
jgi:hypothetical protein